MRMLYAYVAGAALATLGLSGVTVGQTTAPTLSVVQQQEVADESDYAPAGQTIDSQAPYYGWSAPHSFQPWSVPSGANGQPLPSVYGSQYVFTVNTAVNSTSGTTSYSEILVQPLNATSINLTPRNTSNTGAFKKIFIIWMENMEWSWTESDPNWQVATELGLTFTNYTGISHPSEPNYVALWGGDFFGIGNDAFNSINATNLSDLLDAAGISWKVYQENYVPLPGGQCNNNMGIGILDKNNGASGTPLYQRKHNPAMHFMNINGNNTRCANIVGGQQFTTDVLNNNMPDVSFYTPNTVNDGHDQDEWGDNRVISSGWWVKLFLNTYLPYLNQQNVLTQLTFDEADYPDNLVPYPTLYPVANQIPAILYGPASLITPNTTYPGYVNHYGILDAIEQNFALGSLGRNDTVANNGGQNFFNALKMVGDTKGQIYTGLAEDPASQAVQATIAAEDLLPTSKPTP